MLQTLSKKRIWGLPFIAGVTRMLRSIARLSSFHPTKYWHGQSKNRGRVIARTHSLLFFHDEPIFHSTRSSLFDTPTHDCLRFTIPWVLLCLTMDAHNTLIQSCDQRENQELLPKETSDDPRVNRRSKHQLASCSFSSSSLLFYCIPVAVDIRRYDQRPVHDDDDDDDDSHDW
jgi:hypothetical protein